MNAITEMAAQVSNPMARSSLYRLLALGFKYPTRQAFESFREGQFSAELLALIAALPEQAQTAEEAAGLADRAVAELENVAFEEFESVYVGTFDVGFPEPPCPPYEGLYNATAPRVEIMLEVGAFYEHFGLAMSREEGKRELPDYLCAELEFLHFLCFKEAQAQEAGSAELSQGYRLAQKEFLERHLLPWLPKFTRRVESVERLWFYPDLARALVGFVNREYSLLTAAVP